MEPKTDPEPINAQPAPGLRFTIATRFEAFCPCCGYSLINVAVILLASEQTHSHGQCTIGAVCVRCYTTNIPNAIRAVAYLHAPLLAPHVEHSHGVMFLMPAPPQFHAQTIFDLHEYLESGAPLHQQPYIEPPPPPKPDPQLTLDGVLDALHDPEAPSPYDPPCPADCR